jgi:hypothetical protein
MSPYTTPIAPMTLLDDRRGGFTHSSRRLGSCLGARRGPQLARLALGRPQHRAATTRRTAAAGIDVIDIGRIGAIAPDLVVVGQLLTGLDGADGLDEDPPIVDHRLAIRIAAMVDETRIVAIGAAVDDHGAVHDEQKCMIVADVFVPVALIGLTVRHAIAQVLDDARALADAAQGERAAAVNARAAHAHHPRSRRDRGHGPGAPRAAPWRPLAAAAFLCALTHTATRARIAGWNW